MTTLGIRRDVFTSQQQGRMTDAELIHLVTRPDLSIFRKQIELSHQAVSALSDGDLETAAYIEGLRETFTPR